MTTEAVGKGWQHGSELRRFLAAAAQRIDEIILDAERAAEQIRRDAETEAEEYLSQRRSKADAVFEDQLGRLQVALDGFASSSMVCRTEARHERFFRRTAAVATKYVVAYSGRPEGPAEPEPADDRHDEALIRATQLAIKGTERHLIIEALRREFVQTDPEAIVAEILD